MHPTHLVIVLSMQLAALAACSGGDPGPERRAGDGGGGDAGAGGTGSGGAGGSAGGAACGTPCGETCCGSGEICCVDQHGHNPTCIAADVCPP